MISRIYNCSTRLLARNSPPSHRTATHAGSKLAIAPSRRSGERRPPRKLSSWFYGTWLTEWHSARAKPLVGQAATVRVRFVDMLAVTRNLTLNAPTSDMAIVAEIAEELVQADLADHPQERTITLLAVQLSYLRVQPAIRLELPFGLPDGKRRPGIAGPSTDRAMDAVRERLRHDAVGYATAQFDRQRSVTDVFRELAEKDLGDRGRR